MHTSVGVLVCIHLWECLCAYICGSACVHTSVGVLACIHLWECLRAYICGSACVSVGVLACIHLHILTHMIVTCHFVFQSHRCSFLLRLDPSNWLGSHRGVVMYRYF